MVFALRYATLDYYDRGTIAFDLAETANRIQWGIDHGIYDAGAGHANILVIQDMRFSAIRYEDALFVDMGGGTWSTTGVKQFFRHYGVTVNMEVYNEEAFDLAMAQAVALMEPGLEGSVDQPIEIIEEFEIDPLAGRWIEIEDIVLPPADDETDDETDEDDIQVAQ